MSIQISPELPPSAQNLIRAYEEVYGSTGPGCNPPSLAAAIREIAVVLENKGQFNITTTRLRQIAMTLDGQADQIIM